MYRLLPFDRSANFFVRRRVIVIEIFVKFGFSYHLRYKYNNLSRALKSPVHPSFNVFDYRKKETVIFRLFPKLNLRPNFPYLNPRFCFRRNFHVNAIRNTPSVCNCPLFTNFEITYIVFKIFTKRLLNQFSILESLKKTFCTERFQRFRPVVPKRF